jgi:glycosyltransferase involved in cell wall biosynthesis
VLSGLVVLPELGREVRGWSDFRALVRLVQLMREHRPQIVHTHTAKAGVVGRVAARLAGVPVIVHTYHGHVFHEYFSPTRTRLFLAIERWLSRFTDRLVTVSEAVRQDLLGLGVGTADRIAVVPLGLDLEPFLRCEHLRGQLRAELRLGSDTLLVGHVARLVPIKRHEDFLRAAAMVMERVPTCRAVIVGDGERRAELEGVVRHLGLKDRAIFLGWRRDLDRIYADLALVTLTSANEGSPVALIEAMAAGRAVVATRVGGVPDLVDDGVTGLLVPPKDPAALAEAIIARIADPERRRMMGDAGRKRVHPAFSAERLLSDMDRLYTELVAGKPGAAA